MKFNFYIVITILVMISGLFTFRVDAERNSQKLYTSNVIVTKGLNQESLKVEYNRVSKTLVISGEFYLANPCEFIEHIELKRINKTVNINLYLKMTDKICTQQVVIYNLDEHYEYLLTKNELMNYKKLFKINKIL
jgi:hypothetical protein